MMPTGYTAGIEDGTIATLREYALVCARAFGACISLRDEPLTAPLPERISPKVQRYDAEIAKARAEIVRLNMLSAKECDEAAAGAYAERMKSRDEYMAGCMPIKKRYDSMRQATLEWSPPIELVELKAFMLQQIAVSQVGESSCYPEPVRQSAEQWFADALGRAADDLAYYEDRRGKAIRIAEENNRWLAMLRESLDEDRSKHHGR